MRDETSISSMITWDDEEAATTESTMNESKTEQTNARLDEEAVHIKPTTNRWEDPEADVGLDGIFVDAAITMTGKFGISISISHRWGFHKTNLSRSQAEQMRNALNHLLGV